MSWEELRNLAELYRGMLLLTVGRLLLGPIAGIVLFLMITRVTPDSPGADQTFGIVFWVLFGSAFVLVTAQIIYAWQLTEALGDPGVLALLLVFGMIGFAVAVGILYMGYRRLRDEGVATGILGVRLPVTPHAGHS